MGDCFTGQPMQGWLGAWEWLWSWIRSNPPCWALLLPQICSQSRPQELFTRVPCVELPRGLPHPSLSSQGTRSRDCGVLIKGADFAAGPGVRDEG